MEQQTFTIATAAFDASLLPPGARAPGTGAYREAVAAFLRDAFNGFGGHAQIAVDTEKIKVEWTPDHAQPGPMARISTLLERGSRKEAAQLLRLLLAKEPNNPEYLARLGMVLSDDGQLIAAEEHLRRAVEIEPSDISALVALGVALSRQQKNAAAIQVLESAVSIDAEHSWARLNLGVTLLKEDRAGEAAQHLRHAVSISPDDQNSWLALGDAYRLSQEPKQAEQAYERVLALNPHNDLAEAARRGSSALAQATFETKATSGIRLDAMEYCRAALQHFQPLQKQQIQDIAFEIAMLGRNGFDVNDAERKHRLRTMAGEFTSLQLVCYMYVGFQIVAPGSDIGFDLAREFKAAQSLIRLPGI